MPNPLATYVRPTQTINGNELDMRGVPKLSQALYDTILKSVNQTQKTIQTELPNVLVVTQQQFASLNNYTEAMYNTVDRIMITPQNVMEVKIDREYQTHDDVEATMALTDELKGLASE